MATSVAAKQHNPLTADMEEWDEFLQGRYRQGKFQEVFRQYDLYSKGHARPNLAEIRPHYDDLFAEFFPAKIAW